MLKVQIQVPVKPTQKAVTELTNILRKTVGDSQAEVKIYKEQWYNDFSVVVLKDNSEQDNLGRACLIELFTYFFSKAN